jgi:hypothetical protein
MLVPLGGCNPSRKLSGAWSVGDVVSFSPVGAVTSSTQLYVLTITIRDMI